MKTLRRMLGLVSRMIPPVPTYVPEGLVLYHFPACPFCLRVRLTMRRLGISLPCRNAEPRGAFREQLKAGGGRVQVPCLHIIDAQGERWLYESVQIIAYLRQRCGRSCGE